MKGHQHWLLGALLFLVGCGGILMKPAINNVKKVAVISVYMNRDIYDINQGRSEDGKASLQNLLKAVGKKTIQEKLKINKDDDERLQMVAYAVTAYNTQLGNIGRWEILPPEQVVNSPEYKKLFTSQWEGSKFGDFLSALVKEQTDSEWITPPGMHLIPQQSLVQDGNTHYYGDAKDPTEQGRKALAKVCADLHVDAVAVIHIDAGYRFGKLARLTIGSTTQAKPSVTASLVLVNKDGQVAANTGFIRRGTGERYEGDSCGMVVKDQLILKRQDNKAVEVFNQAIEKSAMGLRDLIAKAYGKN